jgi:subtilisin family serine protease
MSAASHSRFLGSAWLSGLLLALSACGGGGGEASPQAAAPASAAPAATPSASPSWQKDLVLQLKPGYDIGPLQAQFGFVIHEQFGQRPIYRVRPPAGVDADALLLALQGDTRVRFAERDVESSAPEARRVSVWAIGGDAGVYATQWAPGHLRLPLAHASSRGEGVRVAVLDSGIELGHSLFASRLARRADGSVLGRDFVDDDTDPSEQGQVGDVGYGHGTHVAGLVALTAPGARLMPVRVLDRNGRGNGWVLAEALAWAVDPDGDPATDDGAHVINLSLGSTQPTQLLKLVTGLATCDFDDDSEIESDPRFAPDVARCAARYGAVVLAAAGNAGSEDEKMYPAAEQAKGSLAITASTRDRRLADFANRGSWIGLAAPGEFIVSSVPGNAYGTWSGTSMASPMAAGTAALILATWPEGADRSRAPLRQWTSENVVKRMTDRAVKLCGTSMLQLDAAGAVRDEPVADPACP